MEKKSVKKVLAVGTMTVGVTFLPISEKFFGENLTPHDHQNNIIYQNFGNMAVSNISASMFGIINYKT